MTTAAFPPVHHAPLELRQRPQWVMWSYQERDGKRTKVPYNPDTNRNAASDDPKTWGSFEEALAAAEWWGRDGIGFVLSADDPYVFIDLDHAIDIDVTAAWAQEIVDRFPDSYWEVSPSGTGLHGIVRGTWPADKGGKVGSIEAYPFKRFATMTGNLLENDEVGPDATSALVWLYNQHFKRDDPALSGDPEARHSPPMTDDDVLRLARRASNGDKLTRLLSGDTSEYSSPSEADSAACAFLGFYTQDIEQIERILRLSSLQRKKWDENRSYLERTIRNAIGILKEFYRPSTEPIRTWETRYAESDDEPLDAGEQHLPTISAMAWQRLADYNQQDPANFLFGNAPTRIGRGEDDDPVPQILDVDRLRHEVAEACLWDKWNERAKKRLPAMPPNAVIRNMLAARSFPLPVLHGIVQAPVIGPDGSVSLAPGYHAPSRLFYAPAPGLVIPAIPDSPTREQVAAAVALIRDELLGDFPFTGNPERAHAIAMLLLPYLRPMIEGPTPLHLIEKPQAGTGAGLLITVAATIATGRGLPMMTEGEDEDEWRKRITALLRTSPTYAVIDNLRKPLDSAAVSAALTSELWQDRKLGVSETITLPNRCVWVATGNNPALSAEISRRTIRIRLDAKQDRPWERTEFRHAHLAMWAEEHRGELIAACLTIGKAWVAAGRPDAAVPMTLGSFEHWTRVMGGVLHTAGIPGFLENLNEFYESSDTEGSSIREFLSAWWQQHGSRMVSVGDLFFVAVESGLDLGTGNERSQKTKLGKEMKHLKDRHYTLGATTVRIVSAGTKQGAQQWRLSSDDHGELLTRKQTTTEKEGKENRWIA